MPRPLPPLVLLAAALFSLAAPHAAEPVPAGPLSPEQALPHFRLPPGLRLELVAAEPDVQSPVAMAFDANHRLWVVEMPDYPNGPAPGQPPEGRIKILEDDGTGRYRVKHVFAERLLFANGLLLWKDGAIVTAAPHIALLRDTDGDGKADRTEILYEGFATENAQLRVSNPVLGLDGWVYVANGLRGGKVKRAGRPDAAPIDLAGMDFRFDLRGDRAEAVSGMGQFGNTFDADGRRYVCDNRHHLRHVVIENHYLRRNPFLAAPAVVEDISILGDGPLSSGGKIYPISRNWTTSSLHVGRFTAACGVLSYQGDFLPHEYRGGAFTCDPTGNLVHHEVLKPRGATFTARPAREGVEFLATTDEWFRPVNLADGPKGELYIVDMYRAVIEHPEFMPVELKKRPDLLLGKERGRIWRVLPDGRAQVGVTPLGRATQEDLLVALDAQNGWTRTTAHRLLLERGDPALVPSLRRLLAVPEPRRQLRALRLLESLGAADADLVDEVLARQTGDVVREHAVALAEPHLAKSERLQKRLLELAPHADGRVAFQLALTLGAWDSDLVVEPLAGIALRGSEDRWTRLAVASAVPTRAGRLLTALLGKGDGLTAGTQPGRLALVRELAALVGARRDPAEAAGLLGALATLDDRLARWQMTGVDGLAEGMGRRGTQLTAFVAGLPSEQKSAESQLGGLFERAARVAADDKADVVDRLTAVRLLGHAPWEKADMVLGALVQRDGPQDVRLAAVRALSAQPRPEVAARLLQSWSAYTPALRREVAEALTQRPERILALLKEVDAKRIRPADLDPTRTRQLVNHGRPEVRDLARRLLAASLPADRKEVLARYQASLKLTGDTTRGQEVFRKNCATCHRVGALGVDVGPDIADTRTKTPEMLLTDILNPNAAIDSNYLNYSVTLKNGRVLTGLVAAENASSITLRRAENQTEVVLRQDVEEILSTGVSLMPEGVEKTVNEQEMADLIAFLKNWRYLDGKTPLGK